MIGCSASPESGLAHATEHVTEDILSSSTAFKSEFSEDISKVEIPENILLSKTALESFRAERVILFSFLLVTQNGIGLTYVLESTLGIFIVSISIRVVLHGQFAVGLLDLFS